MRAGGAFLRLPPEVVCMSRDVARVPLHPVHHGHRVVAYPDPRGG